MPYISERWPGGMLTNFVTVRKAVRKMDVIDRMKKEGSFATLSKRERLQKIRLRAKLEKNLGSISKMEKLPGALFVVDVVREQIAVREATKLKIPVFALVDTNADPRNIDFIIPANDDSSKSIKEIFDLLLPSIKSGLQLRREKIRSENEAKELAEEKKKKEKSA